MAPTSYETILIPEFLSLKDLRIMVGSGGKSNKINKRKKKKIIKIAFFYLIFFLFLFIFSSLPNSFSLLGF